ncbi:hypothetical protein K3495_g10114 [Podosphaera aphanis]|nr:hypothetical protein K3495_g10114 [Podosphaera aphanis]
MIPQMIYRPIQSLQYDRDSRLVASQLKNTSCLGCSSRDHEITPYFHADPASFHNTFHHELARGFGQIRPGNYMDSAEHMLRRKTPNGTLAAGYDGTSVQWSKKAPAQKHVVLPISEIPHQKFNSLIPTPHSYWTDFQSAKWNHELVGEGAHPRKVDELTYLSSKNASFRHSWDSLNTSNIMEHYPKNDIRVTSINQPPIQFPPGITTSNDVGMYCSYLSDVNSMQSPPVDAQPHPSYLVKDIHETSHPLNYTFPQFHQPSGQWIAPVLPHNPEVTKPLYQSYTFSKSNENLQPFPNRHGQIPRLASTFDGYQPPSAQILSKADNLMFKEKVLSWAYRIYVDLLVQLKQSKKETTESVNPQVFLPISKYKIYPKPPRQLVHNLELLQRQGAPSRDNSCRSKPTYDHHSICHERMLRGEPNCPDDFKSATIKQSIPYYAQIFQQPLTNSKSLLLRKAKEGIEILTSICNQNGWDWIDGILIGGCLAYGIGEYNQALEWYSKIISLNPNHIEAMTNLGTTLLCLNRRKEAEQLWLRSIKICPSYFEPVEHLVGLLCSENRAQEAVEIIDFVQNSLRLSKSEELHDQASGTSSDSDHGRSESLRTSIEAIAFDFDMDDKTAKLSSRLENDRRHRKYPGFSSSGFSIPGSENGRILSLLHAKGNMLYALGDVERAAKAFEDVILISAGKNFTKIQQLISKVVEALSLEGISPLQSEKRNKPNSSSSPLLLPPDRALQTAKLLFSKDGDLPGLRYVSTSVAKKSAVATTSNSLLSLAKIYQDTNFGSGSKNRLSSISVGVGDIFALYYLSLSLQPSPSTANNVGILIASVQQTSVQWSVPYKDESHIHRNFPGIVPGSSTALALAYYNYGLDLDPKHAHIYTNLGSLLKDIGQLTAAILMYERAVACDGSFDIALANLANAVKDQGHTSDAIKYYRRAVASNPDFAEAICGLANALNSVCDWAGRGGVQLNSGKFDRWHVDKMGMIMDGKTNGDGSGWMKRVVDIVRKQLRDGSLWGQGSLQGQVISQFLRDLEATDSAGSWAPEKRSSIKSTLISWSGDLWEGSRIIRLVERAIKRAMRRWYIDRHVKNQQLPSNHYPRPQLPSNLTLPSAPTVLPFHTFTFPLSAKDVRMISQRNALRISCSTMRTPWMQGNVFPPPPPPSPHLNVGYVSSDFNNHPLSHLMQSVFGMHDISRVKAFCYATTASDNSPYRKQIEREAPAFYDVHSWPADRLVKQISEDNIHILVNLNGYTRGARNEIFAARPAPIQMSFMGFAGTLGAEWCDYLLADKIAVPPETLRPWRRNLDLEDQIVDEKSHEDEGWVYSENIIFCRDTFFCCDHAQSEPGAKFDTWEEEQSKRWKMRKELFPNLSDDAIILGNFNQLYKIEPTTFRTWLRILDRVPKAILWLLRFPDLGENNLKKTALDWAGESVASRIWFTNVAPKHQHISRARVCDLFLDTPECNAHTTAADVLWSSTPLLTLPRYKYKMCSRIAASILRGALPKGEEGHRAAQELIAENDEQYENLAIKLANDFSYKKEKLGYSIGVGRLNELRKLLYDNRWTCPLFNTKRWVSDLEEAYEEAWRRWVADEGGDIYL